jgi:hypothetical protein
MRKGRSGECGGPKLLMRLCSSPRARVAPTPSLAAADLPSNSTPGAAHSFCNLVTMTWLHCTIRHYLLHSFFPIPCLAALMWVA